VSEDEAFPADLLIDAQDRAAQMFAEIERRPGNRVLHRAGVRQPDAAHRPHRACLQRILEVHLTDPVRGFGGFYEELLDIR
jgi:hypothetical protein